MTSDCATFFVQATLDSAFSAFLGQWPSAPDPARERVPSGQAHAHATHQT